MTDSATIRLEPSGDSFACSPGETILRAGLAAGFAMPYECASGSCSSCKGKLIAGEVEHIWADATRALRARPAQGRPHPLLPGAAQG